jgi:hypothetical protein
MIPDGWRLRRTVLIGIGAVGASALVPDVRVRADDDKPRATPVPAEPYVAGDDAAQAQRAVLYEEDPANPNGRRFAGSAVWSVGPGSIGTEAGRPPETVLRARITIPDRLFTLQWSMRRNTEKSLPANHTVELQFELPDDYQHGGIQSVPGMLAKTAESARGMPLAGLSVKVKSGYFMIGLSGIETESQRNIMLLKERSWLDVPIVYTDGRRAILAIEKGPAGERAFGMAFAAWEGGDPPAGDGR